MNSRRRTGYGVYDLSRQIARRLQREWEMVESPPLPPFSALLAPAARQQADVVPFHAPNDPRLPPTAARPVAA